MTTDRINSAQFDALAKAATTNPKTIAAARDYLFTGRSAYAAEHKHGAPLNTAKRLADKVTRAHAHCVTIAALV